MASYATVNDVITLWKSLTSAESTKVQALLPLVSEAIDYTATKYNRDIMQMLDENPSFAFVLKIVTVGIVKRYMLESDESTQLSQTTESALGYSFTGTFLNGGGGLRLLPNEIKQLGFRRQRIGFIDLMGGGSDDD